MTNRSRTFPSAPVVSITRRRVRITLPLNNVRPGDAAKAALAIGIAVTWIWISISVLWVTEQRNAADRHTEGSAKRPPPDPLDARSDVIGNEPGADRANWALVVVGAITFLVVGWQAWETRRAADAAATGAAEAKRSAEIADRSADAASDSARAAASTLATNREIERAYIAISHKDVDFIRAPPPDEAVIGLSVIVNVRNYGKTPGDILGGYVGWILEPENVGPNLARVTEGTHLTRVFLLPYPEGMVDFSWGIQLRADTMRRLMDGEGDQLLWFVGEVDYKDRFGKFHRGGYGRRYDRRAKMLVFDQTTTTLNYDRPLSRNEVLQRAYDDKEHEPVT
jgi:hypothetical protein